MNKTIVIYHGGCRDGFCSAWVYNTWSNEQDEIPEIEYYPGFYGQEPPDIKGKDVIILDFCYPLEVMQKITSECNTLIWLDHHKTALPVVDWFNKFDQSERHKWDFDNSRSGAGLTWDFFFHNEPRPWLVDYVEDRDLWAKKLNNTDEVNAYIACLKFDFKVWDDASQDSVEDAASYGDIAMMKTEQYVEECCKNSYKVDLYSPEEDYLERTVLVFFIPVVNICQVDCSEVLHELTKRNPDKISMYWFKRADGMYQYGLRSIGDVDVSEIAKKFGGGGHKNAAGFQLKYLLKELQ